MGNRFTASLPELSLSTCPATDSENIRGRLWSDNTNTQTGDAAEEACGTEM